METVANNCYPLQVAYDGYAFVDVERGTGKGAFLVSLISEVSVELTGLAPRGIKNTAFPLLQFGAARYLVWQQTWLPILLLGLKPDVFLAANNTAPIWFPIDVKLVSIVYDLILLDPLIGGTVRQKLRHQYRGWLLRRTIQRSALILTVSQFTANLIAQRFPGKRVKIVLCSLKSSWYARQGALLRSARDPYVLFVTSDVAHKNISRTFEAFAMFKLQASTQDVYLRMVGVSRSSSALLSLAKRFGIMESVTIEPFIEEGVLQGLYRKALCVIVPSLVEGFGIPALEAMASGTPLVCSNTSALPEVAGDAAIFFDPYSKEEIAGALLSACYDELIWERLCVAGLVRAEAFHAERIKFEVQRFWADLPTDLGTDASSNGGH